MSHSVGHVPPAEYSSIWQGVCDTHCVLSRTAATHVCARVQALCCAHGATVGVSGCKPWRAASA